MSFEHGVSLFDKERAEIHSHRGAGAGQYEEMEIIGKGGRRPEGARTSSSILFAPLSQPAKPLQWARHLGVTGQWSMLTGMRLSKYKGGHCAACSLDSANNLFMFVCQV